MKYNRLHINRFGKLVNRTIEFQDGIHVIYGPNESGKSTLHAFLEAMLFGMERRRGRAAKTDNYNRYYPAEGASTYGGVLEFTQDDTLYAIYRNFHKDPTGFTLMDETHGRECRLSEEEYHQLLAGLTLPLYRNTISLRQLQAATSDELRGLLQSHIVNLRTTGSGTLDLGQARERLAAQRKERDKAYDKNAERRAEELNRLLAEKEEQMESYPIPKELAEAETRKEDLSASLSEAEEDRAALLEEIHEKEDDLASGDSSDHSGRRFTFLFFGFGLILLLIGAIFLWQRISGTAGAILCASGLLCAFLGGYLQRLRGRTAGYMAEEQQLLYELRGEEEEITEKILSLQKELTETGDRIQTIKKALWQREQLEEDIRKAEEELDDLAPVLEKNRKLSRELTAIRLAEYTIDRLAQTAFHSFGSYLQETASRLISQITHGRYTRLMISDDMHITLEHHHQPVELSGLSASTLDQVYLALRIACIEFFWPEETMPLLMDESFALYDTDRMSETLAWLAEYYPGQVFLFTCQERERQVLRAGSIAHHVINL
ncbi:MAG: AAA family ATPase [Lachnospiraceae bacterium]|nr:AAA family ATPase [Lachnospiraceae bacterium]